MFEGIIEQYFSGLGVALSKSFARYTSGCIDACSFSTHEIARHVSRATGKSFNTSDKGLHYLLSNDNFQIDDSYWRKHVNLIFALLSEQDFLQENSKVYIQVDFTSNKDHFLILSASIILNNRAIPLYFTMRNYPKRKNQYDHKKMESAFLKGLKHVLSKKYQYVIVCDRGFGNKRFIELCEKSGFEYLIRINPDLQVMYNNSCDSIEGLCVADGTYELCATNWEKHVRIHKCSHRHREWFLVSNINGLSNKDAQNLYRDRFKIEKCFQDMKSAGFDMERTKIRKYSNYKRLLAMCMLSHGFLVLLGHLIVTKLPAFLKNSAPMADVILAYFQSEERLLPYLQKENYLVSSDSLN